jgi:hypothetical protein
MTTNLGRCPSCSSWTINPMGPVCIHCDGKVWPLKPLELHGVRDGTRVNVQGRLYGPNGLEIHERVVPNPEKLLGTVAYLRALLLDYDEGRTTEASVGYEVFRHVLDPILERAKAGEETMAFTSWCGPEPEPAETVALIVVTYAGNVTIKPIAVPGV